MKVLIIEDEEGIAAILKLILEPISCEIIVAHNMNEALSAIARAQELSLITIDLRLPDSTIPDTVSKIKEIRKAHPYAMLVVVTGNDMPGIQEQTLAAGADAFIFKQAETFTPIGFMRVLHDILMRYMSKSPSMKNVDVLERVAEQINRLNENQKLTPDTTTVH